ncbi:MAG: NPCBM/NEW2 domain-containing protein [Clostridium sp.]
MDNERNIIKSVDSNIQAITTSTTVFDIENNLKYADYNTTYKIPSIKVQSISTTGGQYSSSAPTRMFDGDKNTHWETGNPNSSSFKNEVTVTFTESITVDKLVLAPRMDSYNKGYAYSFEIYTSTTTSGTFDLIATVNQTGITGSLKQVKFPEATFIRLKLKFLSVYNDWVSISELGLYKKDALRDKIDTVFTDGTMTVLAEAYKSQSAISGLITEINSHPLKDTYIVVSNNASLVLQNPSIFLNDVMTATQKGDQGTEAVKRGINSGSYSFDVFGKYITPGETIRIYVEADEASVMPRVVLGQIGLRRGAWDRWYSLRRGLNEITAPAIADMAPAAIYIINPALPSEQPYPPRARLEGGTSYPVYRHGITSPQSFRSELESYVQNVSYDIDADFSNGVNPNKKYNLAELTSENVVTSTSATGALRGLRDVEGYGETVWHTMNSWEILFKEFQDYSGFSITETDERFTPYPGKMTNRVFENVPWAYAGGGHTGYTGNGNTKEGAFYADIAKPIYRGDDWAYAHEWGHKYNHRLMVDGEISNNLYSVKLRRVWGFTDHRVPWDYMHTKFSGGEVGMGYFESLGVLTQMEAFYGDNLYAKAFRISTMYGDTIYSGISSGRERLVIGLSLAAGYDFTYAAEFWGYLTLNPAVKAKVSHLPTPPSEYIYIDDRLFRYTGSGFKSYTKLNVSRVRNDPTNINNSLKFYVSENSLNDLLGFEIKRDKVIVGYTRYGAFLESGIDITKNYNYEVTAIDQKLKKVRTISNYVKEPKLSAEENIVIVKGSSFNPLDYIKADSFQGSTISEFVKILGSVNTSQVGIYEIIYILTYDGITTSRRAKVEVVNTKQYVSDLTATSVTIGFGGLQKDKAPNAGAISLYRQEYIVTYQKGLGAHAASRLVYNIENLGYKGIRGYVGVNTNVGYGNGQVSFEVYLDGVKIFSTTNVTSGDDHRFVTASIVGGKVLELVATDGGNGNGSDHSVWADLTLIN